MDKVEPPILDLSDPITKWDYFERTPRPLLRWVCIPAVLWALGADKLVGDGLDLSERIVVLIFIGGIYGIRGLEKLRNPL